ncbi:MAG: hypothetical protein Q9166_006064 [cf. Caloplaca sp. 2 TL-2023]
MLNLTFSQRALQLARDQLCCLRGDVSFIDNALQLAASLRVNVISSQRRPSVTITNSVDMPPANENTPAGSLLARGSALDLQSIQDGPKIPSSWDSPSTARASQYKTEPSPKRRRVGTRENLDLQHQNESGLHSVQQRLASRDAMPPPSRRLLKKPVLNQSGPWSFSQSQSFGSTPMKALNEPACSPNSYSDVYSLSHTQSPTQGKTLSESNYVFSGIARDTDPVNSSSIWEQQHNDSELDKRYRPSVLGSCPSGVSTNRLTLPPSTPSAFNYATPRRRVGISANARTSQQPFLTPESLSSLHEKFDHREVVPSNQPIASPHFSNRVPAASHAPQRPYTNGSVPRKFSWLTAPLGQDQRQDQGSSASEKLQNQSGAYRRPGGPRHPTDQPVSVNSFSFTNQPQIGGENVGRRSSASFANHGRRAVRR